MQVAGSAASGANGKVAREVRFGASGESGNFLMPHVNPFDFALMADGIGQTVQAIAHDAVNPLHA
jgi:hypothetical protein